MNSKKIFSNLSLIATLSAAVMVLGTAQPGTAQPGASGGSVELAYDDGTPNVALTFSANAGGYFVTRFTPPSTPAQLTTVKYFLADTSGGTSFDLVILKDAFGEPGDIVAGPIHVSGGKPGWNVYDLSSQGVTVWEDFYVELLYDNVSKLTLGAEDHEPLAGRAYDSDG